MPNPFFPSGRRNLLVHSRSSPACFGHKPICTLPPACPLTLTRAPSIPRVASPSFPPSLPPRTSFFRCLYVSFAFSFVFFRFFVCFFRLFLSFSSVLLRTKQLENKTTPNQTNNQFIQKKNRLAVYSYLFKEGVLVAKKDFFKAKHDEIEDVPNLEVLALMKSMKSRGLVRETFNW